MLDQTGEKYIAKWDHTKWLVLSSFFFIFPAIYAHNHCLYSYSVLLIFTSLISANYWRKATYSWRRNADLLFAKISFIIFAQKGIYITSYYHLVPGYTGLVCLSYCYYLSEKQLLSNRDNWYNYHAAFHFFIMCEQFIVIDNMVKNPAIQNIPQNIPENIPQI
jgi:hypothetical protein